LWQHSLKNSDACKEHWKSRKSCTLCIWAAQPSRLQQPCNIHPHQSHGFRTVVLSTLLSACETWTLYRHDIIKHLESFQQRKLRQPRNTRWGCGFQTMKSSSVLGLVRKPPSCNTVSAGQGMYGWPLQTASNHALRQRLDEITFYGERLMASDRQRRNPTKLRKGFLEVPVKCFFEVEKTRVDIYGIFPRFLENLLESENMLCRATARKKAQWVLSSLASVISRHLLSRHLAFTFFQKSWGKCPGSWCIPFCLLYCVWGWLTQFANPCVPSRSPCPWKRTSWPESSFVQGFKYFTSDFIKTCTLPIPNLQHLDS